MENNQKTFAKIAKNTTNLDKTKLASHHWSQHEIGSAKLLKFEPILTFFFQAA